MSCYGYKEDTKRFVELFNRTVESVHGKTRLCTHLCFGNFKGHPVGYRRYAPLFPDFLDLKVDELHVEMANREYAELEVIGEDAAVQYSGLDSGQTKQIGPWKFTGITAAHNEVKLDKNGHSRFMGFVVEFGPFCVYHSGDTLLHKNLVTALSPFSIDVAMLPINGNKPERRVAGNLNGTEAAGRGKDIGAELVIPCHYHLFTFNTEEPDEFVSACENVGQEFQIMHGGERLDFTG